MTASRRADAEAPRTAGSAGSGHPSDAAGRADRLWLGIDLGTQSAKAVACDDEGHIVAESRAPIAGFRDGARHEQSADDWVDAVAAAVSAVAAALDDPGRVAGAAICSTSGTVQLLDDAGRPAMPAIMYDDTRAARFAPRVAAADPERWARLGVRVQPSWAICAFAWLAEAGRLGPGMRIAHQGDVVGAAMAGHPVATDWSSALKSGYDLLERRWPASVLDALGVPADALPEVVAPGTLLGETSPAWAERTGLPAGIPLVAGMTDGCAAQLGAGALGPGDWHSVLGTTLVLKGVADSLVADDAGAVYSHLAPDGRHWLPGGASSTGAGIVSELLPGRDLDALAEHMAGLLPDVPVAYPLVGRGERFPLVRPDAEGFFMGASGPRPLGELPTLGDPLALATVFTGVAAVERLAFERLADLGAPLSGRLSTSGGGSRSRAWTRLRATMLGRPIAVPESAEASLGMAVLAAWAIGDGTDAGRATLPAVAARMSRVRETIDPDPALAAPLDDAYGRFTDTIRGMGWI